MIRLENVRQGLPHRARRDARAGEHQSRCRAGRVRLDHGTVGLRQEHAAEPDRAARRAEQRRRSRSTATQVAQVGRPAARRSSATRSSASSSRASTSSPISRSSTTSRSRCCTARRTARRARKLAQAALDRVGLASRIHHFPTQLSGGQQQRVAIARAIVGKPRILLADEPTGNLDSAMGDEIMDILHDLNKKDGTTIVMVTHDDRFARRTDRIVRLFDGRQVA